MAPLVSLPLLLFVVNRPDHHAPGGGYRNPWAGSHTPNLGDVLRWMLWERLVHRLPKQPSQSSFVRATPSIKPRVVAPQLAVTWIGHASFLLQLDGVNILTDPVWSNRASPLSFLGPARWVPPSLPIDTLPAIDAILISHTHYDHFDDVTIRRLAKRHPSATWFAPLGVGGLLTARAAERVVELDWWEKSSLGDFHFACSPARHGSARGLGDRGQTLWCSWDIISPSRRIHFGGDTAYHPDFSRIGERYGPFDVALMPIGAYEPRWFMRWVHMNPEESVQAYRELCGPHAQMARAKFVPMHRGTFKLTDEPMDEPPRRAQEAWEAAGLPAGDFWPLAHGETRLL
ncbi:MAG: MBL fold metallo-hydrolase [Gemmatimonadaceae bacterium]